MTNLLDRITGKTNPARLASQIAEAEARVSAAETARGQAALAFENGGAEADVARAEAEVAQAKARLDRLRAAHTAALAIEAAKATDATRAARKAQDDALTAAGKQVVAKAAAFGKVSAVFVSTYRELAAAVLDLQREIISHPRARQDLMHQLDVHALVSRELSRLTPEHSAVPPGASSRERSLGDPRAITPLVDHLTSVAAAVLPEEARHV